MINTNQYTDTVSWKTHFLKQTCCIWFVQQNGIISESGTTPFQWTKYHL